MEPGHPPSKIPRFADNLEIICPTELNLELGRGSEPNNKTEDGTKSGGFTVFQFQELRLQALIYDYIRKGHAVPCHLVFPIWKSVALSMKNNNNNGSHSYPLYQHVPSLFGNGSMDPEPGRCRRTDGKKWRCKRPAVADHKYCEKHIHRGCNRSKKTSVEAEPSQTTSTDFSVSFKQGGNTNSSFLSSTRLDI